MGLSGPESTAPRRLLWLFAIVLLLPALALAWVSLRFLDQDRELEARQRQDRREVDADRIVVDLERAISAIERDLTGRRRIGATPQRFRTCRRRSHSRES
jgi:uncharacterized protein HemX